MRMIFKISNYGPFLNFFSGCGNEMRFTLQYYFNGQIYREYRIQKRLNKYE